MAVDNKIEFNNITKKFGNIVANDTINFSVKENEVHALLGENGAGKSTLMSILFGLYKPTSGTIKINGEEVRIKDPRHARKLKIAMLPQHFKLVDNMSVLENIMLGDENLPGTIIKNKINELRPLLREAFYKIKEFKHNETEKIIWENRWNELDAIYNEYKKDVKKSGLLQKKVAIKRIESTMAKYDINLDLKSNVGKLSVSDKQKVELLKILWGNSDIIIFDEPTSILTPEEIENFLKLIKNLKKAGKTILLITHKLAEVKRVADRVTIIRKGKYIETLSGNSSENELARMMVGKEIDLNLSTIPKVNWKKSNATVFSLTDVSYSGKFYEKSLYNIDIQINAGEILGIAAIEGNGQSELMKIISGLLKPTTGSINISGHDISNKNIKQRYYTSENPTELDTYLQTYKSPITTKSNYNNWNSTISLMSNIPEDRHEHGIILDSSVAQNAVLQDLKFFSNKIGLLKKKEMKNRLEFISQKYDVRGIQNSYTKARGLSGGNQQKLILGREIERESNVLLATNPTRGLDIGAIRNVYEKIIETRNHGTSILLSSGELDEIMQVSDRIIVIHKGRIVSTTQAGELSKLEIGSLMSTGEILPNSQNKNSDNSEPKIKKQLKSKQEEDLKTKKSKAKTKPIAKEISGNSKTKVNSSSKKKSTSLASKTSTPKSKTLAQSAKSTPKSKTSASSNKKKKVSK